MIIYSKNVVTERGLMEATITVENGRIIDLRAGRATTQPDMDCSDLLILPGIFDTHNHGTCGYSLMPEKGDDPESVVRGYIKGLASQGVTSVFPTATLDSGLYPTFVRIAEEGGDGARILGIHSEGPWLNRVGEKGVDKGHPDVDMKVVQKMIQEGKGHLCLVALAPEIPGAIEAVHEFARHGVRTAYAHSNCNYEQAMEVFKEGITVVTHTGNVMSGLHHRDMGGLGACLLNDHVYNEVICDGLHIRNEMLDIMFRVKRDAFDHFMMISDNVPFSGLPTGRYTMGAFGEVNIDERGFCLSDTGRLCGSARPVLYGIKNLVENLQMDLMTVTRMASLNPCRVYGFQDQKGSIEIGKDADLTIVTPDFECIRTIREGKVVFDREVDKNILNMDFYEKVRVK